MAVRDGRGDVKQTTTGFRWPLMAQSLTSAKIKFLSLRILSHWKCSFWWPLAQSVGAGRNLQLHDARQNYGKLGWLRYEKLKFLWRVSDRWQLGSHYGK